MLKVQKVLDVQIWSLPVKKRTRSSRWRWMKKPQWNQPLGFSAGICKPMGDVTAIGSSIIYTVKGWSEWEWQNHWRLLLFELASSFLRNHRGSKTYNHATIIMPPVAPSLSILQLHWCACLYTLALSPKSAVPLHVTRAQKRCCDRIHTWQQCQLVFLSFPLKTQELTPSP